MLIPHKYKKYIFISVALSLIFFLIGLPFYLQGCQNYLCLHITTYRGLKTNTIIKEVICNPEQVFETQIFTKTSFEKLCY